MQLDSWLNPLSSETYDIQDAFLFALFWFRDQPISNCTVFIPNRPGDQQLKIIFPYHPSSQFCRRAPIAQDRGHNVVRINHNT